MRKRATQGGLTVRAIAGSHAVLLAFDASEALRQGLRGFAIHRTDATEDEADWLKGTKVFPSTDPQRPNGTKHSTRKHPIQDFGWADYSAKPGRTYVYRILALSGPPDALAPTAEVKVEVTTEDPRTGRHDVYFNRGVAGSQEYMRRFGGRRPGSEGGDDDPAWEWLSRGCVEAITEFIDRAKDGDHALYVGAYELHAARVVEALAAAIERQVDVRILHDDDPSSPGPANRRAFKQAGIPTTAVIDRKTSAISHNKFIVHVEGKKPVAVLTGSTNFSNSGIFGHSNVVHVVEETAVAKRYLDYWEAIAENPKPAALKATMSQTPLPARPPARGTSTIFSPREDLEALDYYAALASGARDALFMTFAFGMHDAFKAVYGANGAKLRYGLFEDLVGNAKDRRAEFAAMKALRSRVENRFAVGAHLKGSPVDGWLEEQLSGLNRNVDYIHTKYMLVDPLGDDPVVVTGSANFSGASSNKNDENMLVIRGDLRVADIYLTEFMRLWEHFAFREWANRSKEGEHDRPRWLDETDTWWQSHFGDTVKSRHREYFVG